MRERIARSDPVKVVLWITLLAIAIIWVTPVFFILLTALKSKPDLINTGAFGLPTEIAWENFTKAWERGDLATTIRNSVIISFIKVPLGIFISALAAFALTRLKVPLGKVFLAVIVMGAMIPVQVALAPLFRLVLNLGLINQYAGILLPYIAFGVPFQVFLLTAYFKAIPRELDEAARMDGASAWGIFRRVIIPLSLPALAALFVLDFVATWNEFGMALVILQRQDMWTVPLSLQNFKGQFGNNYVEMNAAIFMSIIPVMVVYLLLQRYFVAGLTSGAVKG
jgi:raffinose/stachyose/melibiose transport system permease protein